MQLLQRVSRAASVLLALFVVLGLAAVRPVAAQHGCDPGNLIPNCNFDTFVGGGSRQVPEGWTPFVLAGDLSYNQHADTYWGAPSLAMWSDGGTFVAGIYTQVGGLQPGATYRASMGWAAPTVPDAFGRRLGIDPTGGTDPNAPTVVWGPLHRGDGAFANNPNPGKVNLDVSAVAKSPTMTVFVYVDHNYSTGPNLIFIDAVGLYQDASAPIQAPATAVPTQAPAPVAPKPTLRRPTATATPTTTLTATATATATFTPAPTATPTITPTPSQTYTPTATPTSTLPPRPRATVAAATAAPNAATAAPTAAAPGILLFGGIGALGGAGLLGVAFVVSRRR